MKSDPNVLYMGHNSLASFLWDTNPDQTPHNVAFDHGPNYIFVYRMLHKMLNYNAKYNPTKPLNGNGLLQFIRMGNSIQQRFIILSKSILGSSFGRVLDLGSKGRAIETHRRYCAVSEQDDPVEQKKTSRQ